MFVSRPHPPSADNIRNVILFPWFSSQVIGAKALAGFMRCTVAPGCGLVKGLEAALPCVYWIGITSTAPSAQTCLTLASPSS